MMGKLRLIGNSALGLLVRRIRAVECGSNTQVRWLPLLTRSGGVVRIGEASLINCRIDFDSPEGQVLIGNRCFVGASHLVCHTRITLGDDVVISWGVTLVDHDSHSVHWSERQHDVANWARSVKHWESVQIAPVFICDRVWVGFGASILKGVTVGEGAVVAARAVVTKNVPPYTVVAGNPARVVRHLDSFGKNP
jgi:galactoside O-acetyltransferase